MGIMNFVKNPNKRMRLDLQNNFDSNVGNDDLWGAEDITAEEFDMLEVQATQEASNLSTFRQPFPPSGANDIQVNIGQQHQYELEGKVKILSDSLAKLKKDLLEEKLNKEKIIDEKVQEFKEKEKLFQKEIQKFESALQFKDQEMKTVYDKVHALEMQLKGKQMGKNLSISKSPTKFLEKFNFKSETSIQSSKLSRQQKTSTSHRKYRLCIDTPQGKSQGCNIVSSMLCNKLPLQTLYIPSSLQEQIGAEISSIKYSQLSAMSVTRIAMEQKTNEIFHYSYNILNQFFIYLKNFADKATIKSNSPISVRKKDFDKTAVISCLKDLSFILSCPTFFGVNKLPTESRTLAMEAKDTSEFIDTENASCTAMVSFLDRNSKNHVEKTDLLLQLLFNLSIPNNYPNEYIKQEEIEWSLAALNSWSLADIKNLLTSFNEQIIVAHINKCYSITATCNVLKLLIQLSTQNEYLTKLIHSNDLCHLCSVSVLLLRKISTSPLECITLMTLVVDFLSAVFTTYSFSDIKLENGPCFVMVLQGFMTALLKFVKFKEELCDITLILKKSFTLLHYLSKYIPDFKERRKAFENLYISLIWEMLTFSKENSLFKDFYDLAHELWDFQEDTSEFDVEDPADDSITAVDTSSQN